MASSAVDREATQITRAWVPFVAALGVALASGLLTMVPAPVIGSLTPDPTEHLAIANAWVHGSGFVDPVKWNWYLPESVPLPAWTVRAPIISILAAIPLALGATLDTVLVLHKVWASLIAGATVLVACRFMRPLAATAAALLLVLSPEWVLLVQAPVTEVTALAAYLAVLATARGVLRSVPGALVCAAATVLAWLTRHVLGALAPAVLAAAAWEVGPKDAARRASIWAYGIGFAAFYACIQLALTAAAGHGVYAGYGFVGEMLNYKDIWPYGKQYVGTWTFALAHGGEIMEQMRLRVVQLYEVLCLMPMYNYVGWLVPPGVLYAILRRRDGVLEHRINAFSLLGFSLIFILTYAVADPRFALLPAAGASFCGIAMVDEAAQRLERRLRGQGGRRVISLLGAAPLAGVLLLFAVGTAEKTLPFTRALWSQYRQHYDVTEMTQRSLEAPWREICPHMNKDAIVADAYPWGPALLFCGNATLKLPPDLTSQELQSRFIDEQHPEYFISVDGTPPWLRESERLREVANSGGVTLFEVRDAAPESRPWSAPPPLVCAGRGPECARRFGR
jgi:hypothetical protein